MEDELRIAVVLSHPVQYISPWLRYLDGLVDLTVFYANLPDPQQQAGDFEVPFAWDVDLLSGYRSIVLSNVASHPDVNRFAGCDTPELGEHLQRGGFDAVVVYGWYLKTYWQAIRACHRAGTPVFVRGDSTLLTASPGRIRSLARRSVGPRFLNSVAGHLYPGRRNREYLEHYGARPQKLFFVPHFVDNDFFAKRAEAARGGGALRLRNQLGIEPDAFVATFVGKFLPRKRPLDLLAAVKRLRESNEDAIALFVGGGPLRSELEIASAAAGSAARIIGFRNQSELPAVYAASDVLVLPSESESWGLVVNEAMASGVGAITTDAVGCAPDLIHERRTGFTFRTGDSDALAARIREYRQIAGEIRMNVRRTISDYSIEKASAGLIDAVKSCDRPSVVRS